MKNKDSESHFYLTCLLVGVILVLIYNNIKQSVEINGIKEELRILKLSSAINNYYEQLPK